MLKENRRVKITKLLLMDSFLHLLAEKPLPHITVKAICEDADLNRSTYYQYYADPYDQMAKLKASIIEDFLYGAAAGRAYQQRGGTVCSY